MKRSGRISRRASDPITAVTAAQVLGARAAHSFLLATRDGLPITARGPAAAADPEALAARVARLYRDFQLAHRAWGKPTPDAVLYRHHKHLLLIRRIDDFRLLAAVGAATEAGGRDLLDLARFPVAELTELLHQPEPNPSV